MFTKKHLPLAIIVLLAAAAAALIVLAARQLDKNTADCQQADVVESDVVFVEATDSGFEPADVAVGQCGSIFITNESGDDIYLAFGTHDEHGVYPGFAEHTVAPGDFMELRLARHGEFTLHNHLRESDIISLTVEKDDALTQYTADELFYADSDHGHDGVY